MQIRFHAAYASFQRERTACRLLEHAVVTQVPKMLFDTSVLALILLLCFRAYGRLDGRSTELEGYLHSSRSDILRNVSGV